MRYRLATVMVFVASLCVAGAAGAQVATTGEDPTYEFSGGYQLLRVGGADASNTYPYGFSIDGSRSRGSFGIVGEVGRSTDSTDIPGTSVSSSILHVAGGPRWVFVRTARIRPYVQILGGVAHARFDRTDTVNGDVLETRSSDSAFMVQPGFGMTFVMGNAWGYVAAADYRRAFFGDSSYSSTNDLRLFVGLRLILD